MPDRGPHRAASIANALSLSRVPLALLIWVSAAPAWVLSVLAAAVATDLADGWIVRRARRKRWAAHDPGSFAAGVARGEVIDGFADKLFMASTVAALAYHGHPPLWTVPVLLTREILFVPLMIAYRLGPAKVRVRVDFTAGVPGKAATTVQVAALVAGFCEVSFYPHLAVAAGALGLFAVVYYMARVAAAGRRARRQEITERPAPTADRSPGAPLAASGADRPGARGRSPGLRPDR